MADYIGAIMGIITGGLVITLGIYSAFKGIMNKMIPSKKSLYLISYIMSLMVIMIITSVTMNIA